MGGACCLGSKVRLVYLFAMALTPMAHSSPMAEITLTCAERQKGLQSLPAFTPPPSSKSRVDVSLLNVTRHSPGSHRPLQTWPRFPCQSQCRAHAGPPWCRHCHPSGSCSCQWCSPTGEGPQNDRVRWHDRRHVNIQPPHGVRGSNTCRKLLDKTWNISCCMII